MANVTIPLGYKFKFEPEDHELLVFLSWKANGEPLPCEGLIREIDLYRIADPGKLFERTQEKVVYVFTKLKKVAKNGKRIDRSVLGNRTWKGVDGGQPIYDAEGCLVGEKKNFVLVNKMKMKLGYNMKEFSLNKDALRNSRFKDYVICQIKKKAKKARSLKDGNFPEEDIGKTSVSMPAIEGNVMAYSEGYQHDEGNSIAFSQSQGEQTQQCYQFSESQAGTSNLLPMLCGDFDSDKALISSGFFEPCAEEYQYLEVNSWMTDNMVEEFAQNQEEQVEESNELSVLDMINKLVSAPSFSWDDISCAASDLPLVTGMIGPTIT